MINRIVKLITKQKQNQPIKANIALISIKENQVFSFYLSFSFVTFKVEKLFFIT